MTTTPAHSPMGVKPTLTPKRRTRPAVENHDYAAFSRGSSAHRPAASPPATSTNSPNSSVWNANSSVPSKPPSTGFAPRATAGPTSPYASASPAKPPTNAGPPPRRPDMPESNVTTTQTHNSAPTRDEQAQRRSVLWGCAIHAHLPGRSAPVAPPKVSSLPGMASDITARSRFPPPRNALP